MTAESKYLLEINNLTVSYHGEPPVRAVDGVSLRLKKGESLGIIGESGCGKSSLVLGVMGLVKQGDVQGDIRWYARAEPAGQIAT